MKTLKLPRLGTGDGGLYPHTYTLAEKIKENTSIDNLIIIILTLTPYHIRKSQSRPTDKVPEKDFKVPYMKNIHRPMGQDQGQHGSK